MFRTCIFACQKTSARLNQNVRMFESKQTFVLNNTSVRFYKVPKLTKVYIFSKRITAIREVMKD